jgi:hypothetical protein
MGLNYDKIVSLTQRSQMKNVINSSILLPMVLIATGCGTTTTLNTEVQEVLVPVLYCPNPTIPDRPALAIEDINNNTSAGEIAQRYEATIVQLQGYAGELEESLEQYKDINERFGDIEERIDITFQDERDEDTGNTTRSVGDR